MPTDHCLVEDYTISAEERFTTEVHYYEARSESQATH